MEIRGKPRNKGRSKDTSADGNTCYGDYGAIQRTDNAYYPKSILTFSNGNRNNGRIHSTQKPVELIEYLILTYSDVGDLVFDGCCGSCTSGVAAHKTGRNFIGFEIDEHIYKISKKRLDTEMAQMNIYDFI